jgi:hypothetical protein
MSWFLLLSKYHYGDQIKKNGVWERRGMRNVFWRAYLMEREDWNYCE